MHPAIWSILLFITTSRNSYLNWTKTNYLNNKKNINKIHFYRMENLSRAALGHVAAIGDLYDARTDNFVKMSIFNRKISELAMTIHDNQGIDFQLVHTDTYSEKFSKLGVKAELQVQSIEIGLWSLRYKALL